ncbi:MAG: discoidin domain-containing protein, partial [Candidatus Limnocylindrales bacterium]|nr:discoidin domain-containing protein [Candidatus Limnocylindrales bacterium]
TGPVPPPAGPATPPAATGPTWEFPSGPTRPVAHPSVTPEAAVPAVRRGRNPLPLVVGAGILFLLLAGGGAAILLGGGAGKATPAPPGTSPSTATSASAGASLPNASASASSAGAASPGPSAAPATLPPGPAIALTLTGATASSSLANHPPSAAIDGDPTTSWKMGTNSPADQWLEVTFAPAAVTQIQLWNGWQRTQDIYFGNDRPRNVTIRFDNQIAIPLKLVDVEGSQRVDIPPQLGVVGVTRLRITVLDWYPAKKTPAVGSPTTQAPISEIRLFGIPMTP